MINGKFYLSVWNITAWDDKVNMLTDTYLNKPLKNIKWPSTISSLTAYFTCDLMSDLVICQHIKVYMDIECRYWYQVSFKKNSKYLIPTVGHIGSTYILHFLELGRFLKKVCPSVFNTEQEDFHSTVTEERVQLQGIWF